MKFASTKYNQFYKSACFWTGIYDRRDEVQEWAGNEMETAETSGRLKTMALPTNNHTVKENSMNKNKTHNNHTITPSKSCLRDINPSSLETIKRINSSVNEQNNKCCIFQARLQGGRFRMAGPYTPWQGLLCVASNPEYRRSKTQIN